jgi:hypothetical protein
MRTLTGQLLEPFIGHSSRIIVEVAKVGCRLGLFWAELDLGPKIKVVAHTTLYNIA